LQHAVNHAIVQFVRHIRKHGCRIEVLFLARALPPVTLVTALMKAGARVTMEGSILVDDVSAFMGMRPRPTQTTWPVTAMADLARLDWKNVADVGAADDSLVNHFESCCPGHLVSVGGRMASLFPRARTVCWTTDDHEGVRLLSRELRRLWSDNVMKACLVTSIEDII
jgi:hypothetical protein